MSHEKYQSCIKACDDCAVECEHCATACLEEDQVKMLARCIQRDRDCADICRLALTLMARGSEFVSQICALCAEICQACGDECVKHKKMEHCQRCAEACYRCAEECRKIAKM